MAFETPFVEEMLEAVREYRIPADGGMYVARVGEFTAAVIIPPRVRGFADFRCEPRIEAGQRSVETILYAIGLARLWGEAKLPGDILSAIRQRSVLRAIARHIFFLVGGEKWATTEVRVESKNNSYLIHQLMLAVSRHREEIKIATALELECSALAAATNCEAKVERLASLLASVGLVRVFHRTTAGLSPRGKSSMTVIAPNVLTKTENPKWFAEFALRLASDPSGIMGWAGDRLRQGLTHLLELPTLGRAARFLVIATDCQSQSHAKTGELYAGWGWK
jgi:hypothetical protein